MPIKKAVIVVAGYGTRFLPATKAMPKTMLPIIDKPVIQYIVEEVVASGITDITLVTNATKRAVEDHFDDNENLEAWLEKQGKTDLLQTVKAIGKMAHFTYIRQKGPYGNGTPVSNVRHLMGNEPFAVLFEDEIMVSDVPRLKQMIEVYDRYEQPVLAGMMIDDEGTKKYGVIDPLKQIDDHTYQVKSLVEKPGPEKTPSHIGSMGVYILTPEIFDCLDKIEPGKGGEYYLIDAVHELMKQRDVYVRIIDGIYLDTGSKLGWLKANLVVALQRPDMRDEVREMIEEVSRA